MKKAKECLQALGPAPPKEEPWMARRDGSLPTPSPSPKNLSSSSSQQPPLDGSASSVASTVSTNSSLGLGASNGTGGRSHSSVSLSSLAGSGGPSPRNGYGSSFTFSEPPTPTSGGGIKRCVVVTGLRGWGARWAWAWDRAGPTLSVGQSPLCHLTRTTNHSSRPRTHMHAHHL